MRTKQYIYANCMCDTGGQNSTCVQTVCVCICDLGGDPKEEEESSDPGASTKERGAAGSRGVRGNTSCGGGDWPSTV